MSNLLQSILNLLSGKDEVIVTEAMMAQLSPPDERDYPVGRALEITSSVNIPADFSVWQPPVADQGFTGNCVAQSVANVMECIDHNYGYNHKDYSVGFIYGAPENTADYGMYPRDACDIVLKRGDLLAKEFECLLENPLCSIEWNAAITPELEELAKTRKVMAYVRINTKQEMQLFMMKYNLPVIITGPTSAFYRETDTGRHATVCYGWISEETYKKDPTKYNDYFEDDYEDLLFTNSWGTYMHHEGRGSCKFEDIEEIWGIVPMDKVKLTDIQNHWAQKDIEYLVNLGIISGYADNTFRPENTITRAEVASLLARVMRALDK